MKKFDTELEQLHDNINEMAQLANSMVQLAVESVKDRRCDNRETIELAEMKLDQMQVEVDQFAVKLMTMYGPVAKDLRDLLVVTHVTSQLERMGDQVLNVVESLDLMRSDPSEPLLPEIRKMALLAGELVEDAITAYAARDADKADEIRGHDDLVDALNLKLTRHLLREETLRDVLNGTRDIADALAQLLVARHLERIADQAVNICKEVVYMVRGDDVRHPV